MKIGDIIRKNWPSRHSPHSAILLGKVADQLRFKEGLTFNDVKEVFERAIGQPIHMAEFDQVMAESEEQERIVNDERELREAANRVASWVN